MFYWTLKCANIHVCRLRIELRFMALLLMQLLEKIQHRTEANTRDCWGFAISRFIVLLCVRAELHGVLWILFFHVKMFRAVQEGAAEKGSGGWALVNTAKKHTRVKVAQLKAFCFLSALYVHMPTCNINTHSSLSHTHTHTLTPSPCHFYLRMLLKGAPSSPQALPSEPLPVGTVNDLWPWTL